MFFNDIRHLVFFCFKPFQSVFVSLFVMDFSGLFFGFIGVDKEISACIFRIDIVISGAYDRKITEGIARRVRKKSQQLIQVKSHNFFA